MHKRIWAVLLGIVLTLQALMLPGCSGQTNTASSQNAGQTERVDESTSTAVAKQQRTKAKSVDEKGTYTSKDDVALYLHTYGHLPSNYVTKEEAEDAGWKTEGLSLKEACPGKSIGGDRFGNYEKKLPTKKGRVWYECDIGYKGGSRGAKRIVYSNDGMIYYTEDHYKTFERLY